MMYELEIDNQCIFNIDSCINETYYLFIAGNGNNPYEPVDCNFYIIDTQSQLETRVENDLPTIINNKNYQVEANSQYHEKIIIGLGGALIAFELAYTGYALYVCTPFAISSITMEFIYPSLIGGAEARAASKILLNMCLMNWQMDILRSKDLLNFPLGQAAASILSKPFNTAATDTSLHFIYELGNLDLNVETIAFVKEEGNKFESNIINIFSSSLKRGIKYILKLRGASGFEQAMEGDIIRDGLFKFIDWYNDSNNTKKTFDQEKEKIFNMTKNNLIKYKICNDIFPHYYKDYSQAVGMYVCRSILFSDIKLSDICDLKFNKHLPVTDVINRLCKYSIKPIYNTIEIVIKNFLNTNIS